VPHDAQDNTILVFALTLACSKEPKTVAFYVQHKEQRMALMEKANNHLGKYLNPGEPAPDAFNAFTADENHYLGAPRA